MPSARPPKGVAIQQEPASPEVLLLGWQAPASLPVIVPVLGHSSARPPEIPPSLVTYATYGACEAPIF